MLTDIFLFKFSGVKNLSNEVGMNFNFLLLFFFWILSVLNVILDHLAEKCGHDIDKRPSLTWESPKSKIILSAYAC